MTLTPTDNRRFRAALAALLMAAMPTLGAGNGAVTVESIATIEKAAHSYVESLLPQGSADSQITV